MTEEYPKWGKTPRLHTFAMTITEKIDGTNGLIQVYTDETGVRRVRAGSRNRWLTRENDNFGFAAWVHDREDILVRLGEGLHYGEYYGRGIGRHYGMSERRFALFAAEHWTPSRLEANGLLGADAHKLGLDVVPLLYWGPALGAAGCMAVFDDLKERGSRIYNFNNPEGIIVTILGQQKQRFKVTDLAQGMKHAVSPP